jgi:hypothetical protein
MTTITALALPLAAAALQPGGQLPPAPVIPAPMFEEGAVLVPINAMFAALTAGDPAALLRQVYSEGRVSKVDAASPGAAGLRLESWTQFAARMTPGAGFDERIDNPAIEIDGDVALVWAPFTITQKGRVTACGYDHFDLVRRDGAWKVLNLTFSTRSTGCPGQ